MRCRRHLAPLTLLALLACSDPQGADPPAADVAADAPPGDDTSPDVADDVAADVPPAEDTSPDATSPYGYTQDHLLRINHIQALGTHNSYHVREEDSIIAEWNYTHEPLTVQLAEQGIRQFELDLHLVEGQRGFQVFHIPGGDEGSNCPTLLACLDEMKAWSDANPGHLPLFVFMEAKDEVDAISILNRYDELEAEILTAWPRSRVIAPDDVLGAHASLRDAVANEGWPTLGEARDKAIFVLLDGGEHRSAYTEGNTTLAGRLMFVTAEPDSPLAAIVSESTRGREQEIAALIDAGVIVRDYIDGTPLEEDAAESRDAALTTGAHLLSTDYPVPEAATGYVAQIPEGTPARCNPRTAPPSCRPGDVEALPRP